MQYPPPPPQPPQPPYQQQPYPQHPYPQQGQGYPPQQPPAPPKKSNPAVVIILCILVPVVTVGGWFGLQAAKHASSERDCQKLACASSGRCHTPDNGFGCIATSAADCRKAEDCKSKGTCGLKGESCVAVSAEDCRKSTSCTASGECDLVGTECRPSKTEHCSASTACKTSKRCAMKPIAQTCYDPNAEEETPSTSSSSGGVTYTCPSNCTYIGNGKCRCRRR
jgi:hypothetical protein